MSVERSFDIFEERDFGNPVSIYFKIPFA